MLLGHSHLLPHVINLFYPPHNFPSESIKHTLQLLPDPRLDQDIRAVDHESRDKMLKTLSRKETSFSWKHK